VIILELIIKNKKYLPSIKMVEPTTLVAIIAVSCTGLSGLVQVVFHNMIQSRCIKLRCCGCFCERDVLDKEELEIVNKNDKNFGE